MAPMGCTSGLRGAGRTNSPAITMSSAEVQSPESEPDQVESGRSPDTALGLSAADRLVLLVLSTAMLLLIALHLARLTWRGEQTVDVERLASRRLEFQLDVNRATWVEWMQLPEIGEALARRIVADRDEKGPFRSVEDVGRVRGIGPATMSAIRPHLKWTEANTSHIKAPAR